MKDVMATLAENYQAGIITISIILILMYGIISVFALLKRRKYFGDIAITAMIPLYHIRHLFSAKRKIRLDKKEMSKQVINDMF